MDYVAFGRSERHRGLSLRRLRLRGDGARGGAALRRATATGGSAVAVSDPRARTTRPSPRAEFRAEAAGSGLAARRGAVLPTRAAADRGRAAPASPIRRRAPTAILATHESIAADALRRPRRARPRDRQRTCRWSAPSRRSTPARWCPALSHFSADLDAVGVALAETLIGAPARRADRHAAAGARSWCRCVFAPRASHGRAARRVTA